MSKKITVTAPSNIALIKYWGKKNFQEPLNPSISLTLNRAKTITTIEVLPTNEVKTPQVQFFLDGAYEPNFAQKIIGLLSHPEVEKKFPFVSNLNLKIQSHNTFPHSTGIASSASGMAALALGLVHLCGGEKEICDTAEISNLARMFSGSAARSLYGQFAIWDHHYAKPFTDFHADFLALKDAILIVSSKEKKVSSKEGHARMNNHPFLKARVEVAHLHFEKIIAALKSGDWDTFSQIVEAEALTLHAMMMTSNPGYFLMEPQTIFLWNAIQEFKKSSNIPCAMTLDAGPNIHLLYPAKFDVEVKEFLGSLQLSDIIFDEMGSGPEVNIIHSNKTCQR